MASEKSNELPLIDATQGVPNYPPPEIVMRQVELSSKKPRTYHYADRKGLPELRTAIANDFTTAYGFLVSPDEVLVTAGCNAAFCAATSAIVEHGDQVIVPTPYYFNHPMWLDFIGADVVWISEPASGIPNLKQISSAITEKTKALILNNPNNPTGAEMDGDELVRVAMYLQERGVYLILDETYRLFARTTNPPFDGGKLGDVPNVIRLISFSKELAFPGLRVGAIVADEGLIREMLKLHDCFAICAPVIGQLAALAGIKHGQDWQREKRATTLAKSALMNEVFENLHSGFDLVSNGGYFAWVKHSIKTSETWDSTRLLLEKSGVLTLPGQLFGAGLDEFVRVGISNLSEEDIINLGHRWASI